MSNAANTIIQLLVADINKRGLSAPNKAEERGPKCCLQQFPRVESRFCTVLHERPKYVKFKVIEALRQSAVDSSKITSKQLLTRQFKAAEMVLSLITSCSCPNTFIPILLEELTKYFGTILVMARSLENISHATLNYQAKSIMQKLLDAIGAHRNVWSKFVPESNLSIDAKRDSLDKLTIAIENCTSTNGACEQREREYHNIFLASKAQKKLFRSLDAEIQRLFLNSVKTVDIADNQNEIILRDLQETFGHCWAQDEIYVDFTPFGSRISRLGGEDSDLDISMSLFKMNPHNHEREYVSIFNDNRQNTRFRSDNSSKMLSSKILSVIRRYCGGHSKFSCLEFIPNARVPIVKLRHNPTKVEVDICIENQLGVQNTLLLREYTRVDPRIHALLLAVKHWSKNRCLNQSSQGTISSFSWCLMVIYYLHNVVSPAIAPAFRLTEYGAELLKHLEETQSHGVEHCSDAVFELLPLPPSPPVPLAQRVTTAELLFGFFMFYGVNSPESFDFINEKINIRLNGRSISNPSEEPMSNEDDNISDEEEANSEEEQEEEEDSEVEDMAGLEVSMISEREVESLKVQPASRNSKGKKQGESTDWRIKICDPFVNIDLGRCVRSIETQFFIQDELRRALKFIVAHLELNGNNDALFATIAERNLTLRNGFCICNYCNEIGHSKANCPQANARKESKRMKKQAATNSSKTVAEMKSPEATPGKSNVRQRNKSLGEKTKIATPVKSLGVASPLPTAKLAMSQTTVISTSGESPQGAKTGAIANLPATTNLIVTPPIPSTNLSGQNAQTCKTKKKGKKETAVPAKDNSTNNNNANKNANKKKQGKNKNENTQEGATAAAKAVCSEPNQPLQTIKGEKGQQNATEIAGNAALASSLASKRKGKKKSALSKTTVVEVFSQSDAMTTVGNTPSFSAIQGQSGAKSVPTSSQPQGRQQINNPNDRDQIEVLDRELMLKLFLMKVNCDAPISDLKPKGPVNETTPFPEKSNPLPPQVKKSRGQGKKKNNHRDASTKKGPDTANGNLETSLETSINSTGDAPVQMTRKERRLLNRAVGESMIAKSAEGSSSINN